MIHLQTFICNFVEECTYLLFDDTTRHGIIIDCGAYSPQERAEIKNFVDEHRLTLRHHFLTHAHFDHVMGASFIFEAYNLRPEMCIDELPCYEQAEQHMQMFIHRALPLDLPAPGPTFADGDTIGEGTLSLRVIATPGHTPGGVCLRLGNELLFSGDSLFSGCIGRCDLPGGNEAQLVSALRSKILTLPPALAVYPGHGPSTTIAREARSNPYLS